MQSISTNSSKSKGSPLCHPYEQKQKMQSLQYFSLLSLKVHFELTVIYLRKYTTISFIYTAIVQVVQS